MNATTLAIASILGLGLSTNAQYDTLWIGTPDGPSTSLANTPFPTGAASAARTQYLVRAQDLQQVLLPNIGVVGICLQVVDDDVTDPACLLNIHTQMKNDVSADLTSFIQTGLMATSTDTQMNLVEGLLGIVFDMPWQWVGPSHNAIVEVSYERNEVEGISPRIMLDAGLDYWATHTGRTNEPVLGQDITDIYPADVEIESDNSLPVLGLLVPEGMITSTGPTPPAPGAGLSLYVTGDLLTVISPPGTRSIQVIDVCGRSVVKLPARSSSTQVVLQGIPDGCYFVSCLSGTGVIGAGKFIKQ